MALLKVDLPIPVSPMHNTLNVNPRCVSLLTLCVGNDSNPTCPFRTHRRGSFIFVPPDEVGGEEILV